MRLGGQLLDIKAMWQERQVSQNSLLLGKIGVAPEINLDEDVHAFAARNKKLLDRGILYLREKTGADIQFNRNEGPTFEQCEAFFKDHLEPALRALLENLDNWNLAGEVSDRAGEARAADKEILRQYIPRLIQEYQASPADLAGEEIARIYNLRTGDGSESEDVFVLYSVLVECYKAHPDSASCKEGVKDRLQRDAGLLSIAGSEGVGLDDYYAASVDGFLTEDERPGRLLLNITFLTILEYFDIEAATHNQALSIDLTLIKQLWPTIEARLIECTEAMGLPWTTAAFSYTEEVQKQLVNPVVFELEGFSQGVEEAKRDVQDTILLGCLARAGAGFDDAAVLEEARAIESQIDFLRGINPIEEGMEYNMVKQSVIAVLEKQSSGFLPIEQVWVNTLEKLGSSEEAPLWDLEDFKELSIPETGIKSSCFRHGEMKGMLSTSLPNIADYEVLSCLSSQHISDEMFPDIVARLVSGDCDNSIDSVVASIEYFVLNENEGLAKEYYYDVVKHNPTLASKQIRELGKRYPELAQHVKDQPQPSKLEEVQLATVLGDEQWLVDITNTMSFSELYRPGGLASCLAGNEPTYKALVEIMIRKALEGDPGLLSTVLDNGRNILHQALLHNVSEDLMMGLVDTMSPEGLLEKANLGGMEPQSFIEACERQAGNCQVSERVLVKYFEKTIKSYEKREIMLFMLSGLAPERMLKELGDDFLNERPIGRWGRDTRPMLILFLESSGSFMVNKELTKPRRIAFFDELLKKIPDERLDEIYERGTLLDTALACDSRDIDPEMILAICEKTSFEKMREDFLSQAIDNRHNPLVVLKALDVYQKQGHKEMGMLLNPAYVQALATAKYGDEAMNTMVDKVIHINNGQHADENYPRVTQDIIEILITQVKKVDVVKNFLSKSTFNPRIMDRFVDFVKSAMGSRNMLIAILDYGLEHKGELSYGAIKSMGSLLNDLLDDGDTVLLGKGIQLTSQYKELSEEVVAKLDIGRVKKLIDVIGSLKEGPTDMLSFILNKRIDLSLKEKVVDLILTEHPKEVNKVMVRHRPLIQLAIEEGLSEGIVQRLAGEFKGEIPREITRMAEERGISLEPAGAQATSAAGLVDGMVAEHQENASERRDDQVRDDQARRDVDSEEVTP